MPRTKHLDLAYVNQTPKTTYTLLYTDQESSLAQNSGTMFTTRSC